MGGTRTQASGKAKAQAKLQAQEDGKAKEGPRVSHATAWRRREGRKAHRETRTIFLVGALHKMSSKSRSAPTGMRSCRSYFSR